MLPNKNLSGCLITFIRKPLDAHRTRTEREAHVPAKDPEQTAGRT